MSAKNKPLLPHNYRARRRHLAVLSGNYALSHRQLSCAELHAAGLLYPELPAFSPRKLFEDRMAAFFAHRSVSSAKMREEIMHPKIQLNSADGKFADKKSSLLQRVMRWIKLSPKFLHP